MTYLEKIRDIQEEKNYDWDEIQCILSEMEDQIGIEELWKTLKYMFSTDELLSILEYLAVQHDL